MVCSYFAYISARSHSFIPSTSSSAFFAASVSVSGRMRYFLNSPIDDVTTSENPPPKEVFLKNSGLLTISAFPTAPRLAWGAMPRSFPVPDARWANDVTSTLSAFMESTTDSAFLSASCVYCSGTMSITCSPSDARRRISSYIYLLFPPLARAQMILNAITSPQSVCAKRHATSACRRINLPVNRQCPLHFRHPLSAQCRPLLHFCECSRQCR